MRFILFFLVVTGSAQAQKHDISVALIAADHPQNISDVTIKLRPYVRQIQSFNVHSGHAPKVAQFANIDAVLVWENFSPRYPTQYTQLIDQLVQAKKGLVEGIFKLTWRGKHTTYRAGMRAAKGAVRISSIPNHPIFAGVQNLGRLPHYHGGRNPFHPNTQTIASWTSGEPAVGVRTDTPGRMVALGIHPASNDSRYGNWDPTSDVAKLMANALNWAANKAPVVKPKPKPKKVTSPQYDLEF